MGKENALIVAREYASKNHLPVYLIDDEKTIIVERPEGWAPHFG